MGVVSGCHCWEEETEPGDPQLCLPLPIGLGGLFVGFPTLGCLCHHKFSIMLGLHHIQGDLLGSPSLWGLCHLKYSVILGCLSPQALQHFGVSLTLGSLNILGCPFPWVLHDFKFSTRLSSPPAPGPSFHRLRFCSTLGSPLHQGLPCLEGLHGLGGLSTQH